MSKRVKVLKSRTNQTELDQTGLKAQYFDARSHLSPPGANLQGLEHGSKGSIDGSHRGSVEQLLISPPWLPKQSDFMA